MEATGYTKEDILRARNRHPYWKRKKMEGSAERTRKRLAAHDYSGGSSVQWDQALVTEFLGLNRKGPDGRYEQKDWQLAERFGATIPSIQYMRRKLSRVESLFGARASRERWSSICCAPNRCSRAARPPSKSSSSLARPPLARRRVASRPDGNRPRRPCRNRPTSPRPRRLSRASGGPPAFLLRGTRAARRSRRPGARIPRRPKRASRGSRGRRPRHGETEDEMEDPLRAWPSVRTAASRVDNGSMRVEVEECEVEVFLDEHPRRAL